MKLKNLFIRHPFFLLLPGVEGPTCPKLWICSIRLFRQAATGTGRWIGMEIVVFSVRSDSPLQGRAPELPI
uniref:Putative secreted protein n=1 Tax=Anopheles darlingi TaxID=43151 RepID=A0A2M4DD55_ANODA